jgi:hypothetical protein
MDIESVRRHANLVVELVESRLTVTSTQLNGVLYSVSPRARKIAHAG